MRKATNSVMVTFTGKSGSQYQFRAYPLGTTLQEDTGGVYIFTRRQAKPGGRFTHRRVLLGQTDDLRQPLAQADGSSMMRGANYICVHGEKDEATRLGIHQDLAREPRPAPDNL
jgi:hypothetical protein